MISLKNIKTLSLSLLCFACTAQEYNCMTYNIRYDNPEDGIHNWHERKEEVLSFLNKSNPDILGIQEGLENQVTYLEEHLESHNYVGVGRNDGKTEGEYTALYYNASKFEVIASETFWLSTTPRVVSVGWDAALPRICTWARLRDLSTGQEIMVFNTHFDHRGKKARRKAVKLIYRKVVEINTEQLPTVVMGDLNLTPDTKSIRYLQRKFTDPLQTATQLGGPKGTSSGFEAGDSSGRRIDYIFVSKFKASSYQHLDPRRRGTTHNLSDHLPVMAKLRKVED